MKPLRHLLNAVAFLAVGAVVIILPGCSTRTSPIVPLSGAGVTDAIDNQAILPGVERCLLAAPPELLRLRAANEDIEALFCLGAYTYQMQAVSEAREYFERARAAIERGDDDSSEWVDAEWVDLYLEHMALTEDIARAEADSENYQALIATSQALIANFQAGYRGSGECSASEGTWNGSAGAFFCRGMRQLLKADYVKAELDYLKAFELARTYNNNDIMEHSIVDRAFVYLHTEQFDRALKLLHDVGHNPRAQNRLGQFYLPDSSIHPKQPPFNSVPAWWANEREAAQWFFRSAQQGNPVSQYNMALIMGRNDTTQDDDRALQWAIQSQRSFDEVLARNPGTSLLRGHERALLALGSMLAEGEAGWERELEQAEASSFEPKVPNGSGSGFYISKFGHILTNAHVVRDFGSTPPVPCDYVSIASAVDAFPRLVGQPIAYDDQMDLAILHDAASSSLQTAAPLRSYAVVAGERVAVTGFPLAGRFPWDMHTTTGDVVTTVVDRRSARGTRRFRFSAPIYGGNSGGPVLDMGGNVVGVVVGSPYPRLPVVPRSLQSTRPTTRDVMELIRNTEVISNMNIAISVPQVSAFLQTKASDVVDKVDWREFAGSGEPRMVTDLSRDAMEYTVMVECWMRARED